MSVVGLRIGGAEPPRSIMPTLPSSAYLKLNTEGRKAVHFVRNATRSSSPESRYDGQTAIIQTAERVILFYPPERHLSNGGSSPQSSLPVTTMGAELSPMPTVAPLSGDSRSPIIVKVTPPAPVVVVDTSSSRKHSRSKGTISRPKSNTYKTRVASKNEVEHRN